MKIGIVGWGVEGQSVHRYFGPKHSYLIVNEEPRDDFPAESKNIKVQYISRQRRPGITGNVKDLSYLKGLDSCDEIVYTPTSFKNLQQYFGNKQEFWAKATTAMHIFFENCKSKNIIGVTGTKGKGTTCTLIAKMLEAENKKVYLGGNIGKSVLDFIDKIKPGDWVVLELANFQLHALTYSPQIAVCLMIVPEHLDWHPDVNEYIRAKANIFRYQKPQDTAVYFAGSKESKKIAQLSPGKKIPYFAKPGARVRGDGMIVIGENETEIINKTAVKLLGEHNMQNICAACTAVFEAIGSLDKAKAVLSSFSGLEHRMELVRVFEGVKYYDDSFGTTPETAIVAIQALTEPIILIAGGSDKGIPLDGFADSIVKGRVKAVIAIGETAPKIEQLLKARNFNNILSGLNRMPDIVAAARGAAEPGDAVLLSTGCASFGLFKDYKDRGNQFKKAVLELS